MNSKTSSVLKTPKKSDTTRALEPHNYPIRAAVTVKMAASMLSCCEKSIYRLIARGELVPIRLFRTLRFPESQIADLMKVKENKLVKIT